MSYDDLDDRQGGSSFLLGFIAGTVLGAGLALMFAPRPGAEMRRDVADRAQRFSKRAAHEYERASERVSHLSERGREAYETAAGRAREFARRGRQEAERVADQARDTLDQAEARVEAGIADASSRLHDVRERRG